MANTDLFLRTQAQSRLVNLWAGLAEKTVSGCPSRTDINPGAIRSLLGGISLLDVSDINDVRFRLAGSRVHTFLGYDPNGMALDALAPNSRTMFAQGLRSAIESKAPQFGVTTPDRFGHCMAWVRLPLIDPGSKHIRCVLCHDETLSAEERDSFDNVSRSKPIRQTETSLAA